MNNFAGFQWAGLGQLRRRVKIWLSRKTLINRLVNILITLGILCGLLTYAALSNVPPFGDNSNVLLILLNVNLVILLALIVLVSRRIIALYIRRKKGLVGSNLHIRLVFIFSLLAALPAAFMAVFSVGFFYFGLHGWLDARVRTAINESQAVAEAYLNEHQQVIRADILGLMNDLNRQAMILANNREAMAKMLDTQSFLRNFANIALINLDGSILIQSSEDRPLDSFDGIYFPEDDTVLILEKGHKGIAALSKLSNYNNLYAYGERDIDPQVLGHVERSRRGVAQYKQLQARSNELQIMLTSIYVLITLLLTIAAIWFGLSFARRLVRPIAELIEASEQARAGDLSARVDTLHAFDEFKMLGTAFNRMTAQIESQQQDLMDANQQMDFRRRFTETILGGVSTGVISLNHKRKITLANTAAADLLQQDMNDLVGQKISHVMPDLLPHLEKAFENGKIGEVQEHEIHVRRQDQTVRIFLVRIVIEDFEGQNKSAILTFDDLTTVLASQRKAAWADIARRIAHEIKNPLTPIQLSAERLNRKYRKGLEEKDQKVFDQCTETIIRHVDDIKTMVNSFSDFAKMPDPVMRRGDILSLVEDILTLQKSAFPAINFDLFLIPLEDQKNIMLTFDEQQIRQVLTNLIKNASEAFDGSSDPLIDILIEDQGDRVMIAVADNGIGLPADIAHEKLTEPYISHKDKGTGLGLAIVKKIIEDHHGDLLFYPDMAIITKKYSTIIGFRLPKDT